MIAAESTPATGGTERVELTSQWASIWGSLTADVPNLGSILGLIAGAIVVVTLFRMVSRKAGGGNVKVLMWWLLIAAVLAAPGMIIPMALALVQLVMNLIVGGFQSVIGLAGV